MFHPLSQHHSVRPQLKNTYITYIHSCVSVYVLISPVFSFVQSFNNYRIRKEEISHDSHTMQLSKVRIPVLGFLLLLNKDCVNAKCNHCFIINYFISVLICHNLGIESKNYSALC